MDWRWTKKNELYHHGILGQKWGVRRYQNADGTLTAEGRNRYGKNGKTSSKATTISKQEQKQSKAYVKDYVGDDTVKKYQDRADKYKQEYQELIEQAKEAKKENDYASWYYYDYEAGDAWYDYELQKAQADTIDNFFLQPLSQINTETTSYKEVQALCEKYLDDWHHAILDYSIESPWQTGENDDEKWTGPIPDDFWKME